MIGFSLAGDKDYKNLVTSLVMVDIGLYPNQQGADQVIQFMQSGSEGFSSLEEASDVISGANETRNGMSIPTPILEISKSRILKNHWYRAILNAEAYPINFTRAFGLRHGNSFPCKKYS